MRTLILFCPAFLQAENIYNDEDPEGAADTEVQG